MKAIKRLHGMIEHGFQQLTEDETVSMRMDADALMLEIEQMDETIEKQADEIERLKEVNKRFRDAIIKTSFCDGLALVLDIENEEAAQPQKGQDNE